MKTFQTRKYRFAIILNIQDILLHIVITFTAILLLLFAVAPYLSSSFLNAIEVIGNNQTGRFLLLLFGLQQLIFLIILRHWWNSGLVIISIIIFLFEIIALIPMHQSPVPMFEKKSVYMMTFYTGG